MHCSPVHEFHDVSVENFSDIARVLSNFGKEIKWNLMVIPFCSFDHPDFEAFKKQLLFWKNDGYFLHLHGYKHKASTEYSRSFFGKIILRLTSGEAEFAGLGVTDSLTLLDKAIEAWHMLGIEQPCGFTLPAWYGSRAVFIRCKELGFENYNSRFIIWNKGKGSNLSVPFSIAGLPKILIPFIKACEKIYLKLYSIFEFLPIPRIVKHPGDLCFH